MKKAVKILFSGAAAVISFALIMDKCVARDKSATASLTAGDEALFLRQYEEAAGHYRTAGSSGSSIRNDGTATITTEDVALGLGIADTLLHDSNNATKHLQQALDSGCLGVPIGTPNDVLNILFKDQFRTASASMALCVQRDGC